MEESLPHKRESGAVDSKGIDALRRLSDRQKVESVQRYAAVAIGSTSAVAFDRARSRRVSVADSNIRSCFAERGE